MTVGYVDREFMVPDRDGQYPDWADVYDAERGGRVIAKWGYAAGWISLEEASAPGFDLHAVKERAAADAATAAEASRAAR